MDFMDSVLIVGGGGREHALLKAMLRSERPMCMYAYPGNPGMEDDGCMLVERDIDTWEDLADWAEENQIDLTVVGPEQPLVEGIVDVFQERGLRVFGPSRAAARIEGSKEFAKNIMKKYGIPTAAFETFTDKAAAAAYIEKKGAPIVVKASGLAAGKGAMVCDTLEEAQAALETVFDRNAFGDAGQCVVIEEKMAGEEASVFVLTDGGDYKILPVSQDHKPIYDGDRGPNTGGMGAYAPAPLVDEPLLHRIEEEVIRPTLAAMRKERCTYRGLLYAGIMVTAQGPKVVEFNCRFGDPETQAVLPLVSCDWYRIFSACASGGLGKVDFEVRPLSCVAVVMASAGYPGAYEKGKTIRGIEAAERRKDNVDVYMAGVRREGEDLATSGGRVLAVSAWADSLEEAASIAYENVAQIDFEGKTFRRDIAAKGLRRRKTGRASA
jgi:phosphoribosylamine--glycine ligase